MTNVQFDHRMTDYQARCERLADALDEANERIKLLEQALGVTETVPSCLKLTATESRVLGILMKRPIASKETVMLGMYGNRAADAPDMKIVDVIICNMRKKLNRRGISIENVRCVGWMISPEHKQIIAGMTEPEGDNAKS